MAHRSAHLLDDPAVPRPEEEHKRRKDDARHEVTAPRAGRTGGLGTRAERPSEGSKALPPGKQLGPPGRGGKAPSAAGEAGAGKHQEDGECAPPSCAQGTRESSR